MGIRRLAIKLERTQVETNKNKINVLLHFDRLRYAQQRRAEQLTRYREYEQEQHQLQNGDIEEHKNGKSIKFKDSITLLEACARNDYDEGSFITYF